MLFIIIGGLIATFVIWGIGVQRRLVAMDENVNNAMSQIGGTALLPVRRAHRPAGSGQGLRRSRIPDPDRGPLSPGAAS